MVFFSSLEAIASARDRLGRRIGDWLADTLVTIRS
jgi:hypothetical protein